MKRFLGTILVFSFCLSLSLGQDSRLVYQVRGWHPKPMQGQQMEDAMAKKTKKYNVGKENYPMFSFRVITGKDEGAVIRVTPRTFADRDKYPLRKAELDYWQKNVIPYVDMSKDEGTTLWVQMENHSYNGSGNTESLRYSVVMEYLVHPAKLGVWREFRTQLVEAHKKAGSKARFAHYRRFSGGKTHLILMVVPFDSWADYENLVPIFSREIFENAHGEGTQKEWMDRIGDILEYRKTYIREYLPDLSTG